MSKHTPGPWATDLPEHEMPYQDIRIKAGRRDIYLLWIDDAPVEDYNTEQLANARLIAAAPELLEAVRTLAGMAESFSDELHKDHPDVTAARAAISKATGETE